MHLEVTYILTNENEIVIDYRASTDKSTILNIANNAYFNLNGEVFLLFEVLLFARRQINLRSITCT